VDGLLHIGLTLTQTFTVEKIAIAYTTKVGFNG